MSRGQATLMAKRKKPGDEPPPRAKLELRAEPEWVQQVEKYAAALGLSMSAYARMAITERMRRDEAEAQKRQAGQ